MLPDFRKYGLKIEEPDSVDAQDMIE